MGEEGGEKRHQNAIRRLEPIRLNDDGGARLAVIPRRGDDHQIAPLHGSGQGKAASMKAKASFSSGRPRSSFACRSASLANSGRFGSGTQTRKSFMPLLS